MQNRELNAPMEGYRYAHTFPFKGLLWHIAQQQEGKCGRGFSHLGDNAGEARWERSLVLQKTEGFSYQRFLLATRRVQHHDLH